MTNINEVRNRVEASNEVLILPRLVQATKLLEVGVNLDRDVDLDRLADDVTGNPLCDLVFERLRCMKSSLLATLEELFAEKQAATVDDDDDKRIATEETLQVVTFLFKRIRALVVINFLLKEAIDLTHDAIVPAEEVLYVTRHTR